MVDLFPPNLRIYPTLRGYPAGDAWLDNLPEQVEAARARWELTLLPPYPGGSCSWVAPARRADGTDVVLKLCWPHREARGEAAALAAFAGRGAVRLLERSFDGYVMLLERVLPGKELGAEVGVPAEERLLAGAAVLAELWSAPLPAEGAVERLDVVTADWAGEGEVVAARPGLGLDSGLVRHGLDLLHGLPGGAERVVLLHGDFNPGNLLSAERVPWLAIDPKSMVGDPAYDPWPLVEQVDDPFRHADPREVLRRRTALVCDAVSVPVDRVLAWAVARRVETALGVAGDGDLDAAASILAEARIVADLLGV